MKRCWDLRLRGSRADFCQGRGSGSWGRSPTVSPQKLKPFCQYTNVDVVEKKYTKKYILAVLQCLLKNITLAFSALEVFFTRMRYINLHLTLTFTFLKNKFFGGFRDPKA